MRIDPREVTLMKTKSHGLDTAGDVTNARCSSVRTPGPRYAPGEDSRRGFMMARSASLGFVHDQIRGGHLGIKN